MEPERIADYECGTGEGPLWHPEDGVLYWVDIPAGRLFWYDPVADVHECCYERDGPIGGFTIQADGSLLLFEEGGRIERWEDGQTDLVLEGIEDEADSRFNDVIADPRGRVFCGTMPTEDDLGNLYRLDRDGSITTVIEDVDISNGLGFTPDRSRLYYTESEAEKIYRFAYDEATGSIADRETFVDLADEAGVPDGLTVDEEGYVWSARWDGGCLVRYSPDGEEVARVEFPARKVSSVTFGGEHYEEAYVTTALGESLAAGETVADRRAEEGSGAGALFRVELGVSGVPEFRSRIELE